MSPSQSVSERLIPTWDPLLGKLIYGGQIARRVIRPAKAKNIVAILEAFQAQGWPTEIIDPLPDGPDPLRLNDAIRTLNTSLSLIEFYAVGTGCGIGWRPKT